jgi:hypothetical protein
MSSDDEDVDGFASDDRTDSDLGGGSADDPAGSEEPNGDKSEDAQRLRTAAARSSGAGPGPRSIAGGALAADRAPTSTGALLQLEVRKNTICILRDCSWCAKVGNGERRRGEVVRRRHMTGR